MNEQIHIGELIRSKLRENQRSIAWIAKKIGRNKSSLAKSLKNYSMDTKLLLDISIVLQFDFFFCYSEILRNACLNADNKCVTCFEAK